MGRAFLQFHLFYQKHSIAIGITLCVFLSDPRWTKSQTLTHSRLETEIQTYQALSVRAEPPAMVPVSAGRVWSHLGSLYEDAGMYPQSEMAYQHALRLLKVPPVSAADLATALDGMGTLYMMWGDTQQAERAEQKALEIRETERLSADLPRSWYHLATLALREHRAERARVYAKLAVEQLGRVPGSNPDDQINAQFVFALSLCRLGRFPEAIATIENAMQLVRRVYRAEEFPTGFSSFLLGYAYWKAGDTARAGALMQAGSTVVEEQLGLEHPVSICIMTQYDRFLRSTHQKKAAHSIEELLKQAQGVRGFGKGPDTLSVASLF